jgi:cytochrome c oxidase assembly factor CtaG/cytochrome c2
MPMTRLTTIVLAGSLASTPALAHTGGAIADHDLAWSWEPWVLASLAIAAVWYGLGLRRLVWDRGEGTPRFIRRSQAAAFAGGLSVLFLALVSPIDTVGEQLFSVHMVQHLLLMLAAPPLLAWGRPAIVMLWAFPPAGRRRIGRSPPILVLSLIARAATGPVAAPILFCGAFVFWHLPRPYGWALADAGIHVIEHMSFFLTGLAFWSAVIGPSGHRRVDYGAALLMVAATALLSCLPGALMIFAPRPLYPMHAAGAAAWGLTLLQDQSLAGLVMWIPAGAVYVAAIAWLFVLWLREAERRVSFRIRKAALIPAIALLLLPLALSGCSREGDTNAGNTARNAIGVGGEPDHGAKLIAQYGCGGCHTIPGIRGADGLVGPPLIKLGRRVYIAGLLRNTPDNLIEWVRNPQSVVPGNVMPDMGISESDARDIAAYLYTLR